MDAVDLRVPCPLAYPTTNRRLSWHRLSNAFYLSRSNVDPNSKCHKTADIAQLFASHTASMECCNPGFYSLSGLLLIPFSGKSNASPPLLSSLLPVLLLGFHRRENHPHPRPLRVVLPLFGVINRCAACVACFVLPGTTFNAARFMIGFFWKATEFLAARV